MLFSFLKKHHINKNVNIASDMVSKRFSLFAQLGVASIQQISGIRVAVGSLQHEAHNEIYAMDY